MAAFVQGVIVQTCFGFLGEQVSKRGNSLWRITSDYDKLGKNDTLFQSLKKMTCVLIELCNEFHPSSSAKFTVKETNAFNSLLGRKETAFFAFMLFKAALCKIIDYQSLFLDFQMLMHWTGGQPNPPKASVFDNFGILQIAAFEYSMLYLNNTDVSLLSCPWTYSK